MIASAINRLNYIIDIAPPLLTAIGEEEMSATSSPGKWSKKQILGHLIDSAANNHQRFVRGQFEHIPAIRYDQDKWNAFNFYADIDSQQIISFWTIYNKQLIEIIKRIPAENLQRQVTMGEAPVTLEFAITDYVAHLEHHLKQVIEY